MIGQELAGYLESMISPPDGGCLVLGAIDAVDWGAVSEWPAESVCGIIIEGVPTESQSAELMRVLKPGGHLLLVDSMGISGACSVEGAGFEVRDAIFVAEPVPSGEEHSFFYCAKASRAEREAGCESLPASVLVGEESEDTLLEVQYEDCETPKTVVIENKVKPVRNVHPTVKPIEVMEWLLAGVKGVVLDPFMGSGTTGIACMKQGLNFIGIEREVEYLRIARARVEHHVREIRSLGKATLFAPAPKFSVVEGDGEAGPGTVARLYQGDCIEVMKEFAEGSVDVVVCDPPYGLAFMGKEWDKCGGSWHELWLVEAFRVLKSGGAIQAFGGTRTYHILGAAMRRAGFDVFGTKQWCYGSGFPKSLNVAKALGKAGASKELVEKWEGYGTALKPAWEPIIVGRKG